jgi:hypothetical protein
MSEDVMTDVFTSGSEGYPCYRIPALLQLPGGLLLLFAEGRFGGDMGARTDIVYKASRAVAKHHRGISVTSRSCAQA